MGDKDKRGASPMTTRSRHRGLVTDAGLVARRPIDDLGLRQESPSSYVGGGLLRPGVRSAPPVSTTTMGVDNVLYRDQGRVGVGATDQTCDWPENDRFLRPGDGHGGAHPNDFMMTRSSSFHAMPRYDAGRYPQDDSSNAMISATSYPDHGILLPKDLNYEQLSRPSMTGFADFDGCNVDAGSYQEIDGTKADQPTDSGRPTAVSTGVLTTLAVDSTVQLAATRCLNKLDLWILSVNR